MDRLVLAVQYASQGNLTRLRAIVSQDREYFLLGDPYSANSVWSILLVFLPETIDPAVYVGWIQDLRADNLQPTDLELTVDDDEFTIENALSEQQVLNRSQMLLEYISREIQDLGWTRANLDDRPLSDRSYSQWIRLRIKQIDACCGHLDLTFAFMENAPQEARDWLFGIANVVCQFRNLYQNYQFTVEDFENAVPKENVFLLLQSSQPTNIQRDFDKLVVPYVTYKNDWDAITPWIAQQTDLEYLVPICSLNQSLARPVLAACYLCLGSDNQTWANMVNIHRDLSMFARDSSDTPPHTNAHESPSEASHGESGGLAALDGIQRPNFTFDALLGDPMTDLTKRSLTNFLHTVQACSILSAQKISVTIQSVTELRFGSDYEQQLVVLSYIENAHPHLGTWDQIRQNIHTLKSIVLGKVSDQFIDDRVLAGALASADFEFVKRHYSNHPDLHQLAVKQLRTFYDKATNGNKTRGSMKNAANCLALLDPSSPDSKKARCLIFATHDLSEYSLTFVAGEPLKTRDITQHPPLQIVHRVLELNEKSYREIGTLTRIAEELAYGTDYDMQEFEIDSIATHVRAMCVEAALIDNNFKLAYDYCVPHLSTLNSSNVAWTACFQVGKYVSPYWDSPPEEILRHQMRILGYALQICPKENMAGVLSTWKRNDALVAELYRDTAVNRTPPPTQASHKISASRIAKAISSSAAEFRSHDSQHSNRPRTRDQISNLFVNGLGWALGANPQ
jgi:hypothetical protein